MENNINTKHPVKKVLNKMGKPGIWTIILLVIIFISSFFASMIQSNWGSVKVNTVYFEARDSQVVAYDMYTPKTATEDNKAPLIVIIPGFQRSRETQGHLAIEFARRGYVVINIDPYSQGDSTSSKGTQGSAIATIEGYGSFDLIDYIYDNSEVYPFIDKTKIGVTGHSAGGNAAYQAAVHFGQESVNNNGVSKVNSVYISGYVISINSSIAYSKSNMGMDYALYDEGAFRNQDNPDAPVGYSKSDMSWAIESHTFVNSGLEKAGLPTIPNSEQVEIGKIYGNPNLKNMRQVFNTPVIHAFQPYNTAANTAMIDFFEVAMNFYSDSIAPSSMVWIYKEVFTTISLIASLAMIVPLAMLLYRIPWFKKSQQAPIYNTKKRSWGSIVNYLVVFAITATFAALTYLPSAKMTLTLFPEASASQNTWFFPQRMNNAVAVWAVLSGIFAIGVFLISQYLTRYFHKRFDHIEVSQSKMVETWGIKTGWINALKTIIIGVAVAAIYFGILMLIFAIFHVDYRLLFIMAARPLNGKVLIQLLMYFPLFFIFYLSNSIRVNGGQMRGALPEWAKLALAGLMNIAGLTIILLIQYITFAKTGTIAFTELPDGTTQWLYVNILFTLIPVMFLMPFFNRWFYKISGNSYLGPIIICIIFVIMSLNNSVAYIPL
ncbi:MAG: alpha/beta hydrolase [Bacilli bacterium]|jgi:hypothetical protein|nr:alpha/beta hydrolase [Bacilli bacterium]MCH4235428.1 alpha/beta hydrolase [Bacilli bacterium]